MRRGSCAAHPGDSCCDGWSSTERDSALRTAGVDSGDAVFHGILLRVGSPWNREGEPVTVAKRICADGGEAVGDGDAGQ